MKNYIVFLFLMMVSANMAAATGEVTGAINTLRSHDMAVSADWLTIDGVVSAGACAATYGNRVIFYIKDDERGKRMLAVAVAAKMGGKSVRIGWDDVALNQGGACFVRYIDLY
ncbi:MAG: hypothetical protein ACOY5W_05230 [Pseudomonadota bacterium]